MSVSPYVSFALSEVADSTVHKAAIVSVVFMLELRLYAISAAPYPYPICRSTSSMLSVKLLAGERSPEVFAQPHLRSNLNFAASAHNNLITMAT